MSIRGDRFSNHKIFHKKNLPKDEVALDEVANGAVTPYVAVETLASELLVILVKRKFT